MSHVFISGQEIEVQGNIDSIWNRVASAESGVRAHD